MLPATALVVPPGNSTSAGIAGGSATTDNPAGRQPMARERIVQGTLRNLIVAGLVAVAFPAAAQNGDLPRATEILRLSIEEWLREDAAYRAARGAAKTTPTEAEEHAGFVAGLRVRVLEECENVRRLGGEDSIRGFVCTPASGEARPPVRAGAVLTEEEKRAAVQARLNQLEGDIDDSLQKRQQDIRQKAGAASARAGWLKSSTASSLVSLRQKLARLLEIDAKPLKPLAHLKQKSMQQKRKKIDYTLKLLNVVASKWKLNIGNVKQDVNSVSNKVPAEWDNQLQHLLVICLYNLVHLRPHLHLGFQPGHKKIRYRN